MTACLLRWPTICVLAFAIAASPTPVSARFLGFGKKKVERIVAAPAPHTKPVVAARPVPPPEGMSSCVDVRKVAGAQIFADSAVELTLVGGKRWRMYFAQACPALSFYDGFYYRRAELGRLCAGRDAIISRSGGECAIASIVPIKSLRREARRKRSARP